MWSDLGGVEKGEEDEESSSEDCDDFMAKPRAHIPFQADMREEDSDYTDNSSGVTLRCECCQSNAVSNVMHDDDCVTLFCFCQMWSMSPTSVRPAN